MIRRRVLVARLDSAGDVLLAGPAVRAVAAGADDVVLLCGPRGLAAGKLLPGVDRIITWRAPWIDPEPDPVDRVGVMRLVSKLMALRLTEALILTSYHQSALPLALLMRMSGVPRISGLSEDYPGSLLDLRCQVEGEIPEAERALALAEAAGYPLPTGDDGRLRVKEPLPNVSELVGAPGYVVVHPAATVPARSCPPANVAAAVRALAEAGHRVVVTGSPDEASLTGYVSGGLGLNIGGRTDLPELAAVCAGAAAVVVGNTGPAHLAAAVGTPVVSLFAPTVPAQRWAPYKVPTVLLGDQSARCAGTRARQCPIPGHPCLANVEPAQVVAAVDELVGVRA